MCYFPLNTHSHTHTCTHTPYLLVNVGGGEVAECLPASLLLFLIKTDLDVVCEVQHRSMMGKGTEHISRYFLVCRFPERSPAASRPSSSPFWTLSQSRKISSPPSTDPHDLSSREIFRLEALGDSAGETHSKLLSLR